MGPQLFQGNPNNLVKYTGIFFEDLEWLTKGWRKNHFWDHGLQIMHGWIFRIPNSLYHANLRISPQCHPPQEIFGLISWGGWKFWEGSPLGSLILSYQPTLNLTARVLAGEELVVIQWGKWYEKAAFPGQLSKVTPFDDIRPQKSKGYKSVDLMDLKNRF